MNGGFLDTSFYPTSFLSPLLPMPIIPFVPSFPPPFYSRSLSLFSIRSSRLPLFLPPFPSPFLLSPRFDFPSLLFSFPPPFPFPSPFPPFPFSQLPLFPLSPAFFPPSSPIFSILFLPFPFPILCSLPPTHRLQLLRLQA